MYLTQGLHRAVQQTPSRPATIFRDRVFTFAEQRDRVARLAAGLRTLGICDGERVAMLALNSDRYCEYYLAVPWAGAVLNPVNTRWSTAEIVYSLTDSGTSVLLVDDAFVTTVAAIASEYPALRAVVYCGDQATPDGMVGYEDLIAKSAPIDDAYRAGDDLAGIFYTGGTTGFPKGVMLTHTNLVTSALGALSSGTSVTRDGRLLHSAPMFHSADFASWTQQTILGGTHVMLPAFDPDQVLATIEHCRMTDVALVPTLMQRLVDHPEIDGYDLSSLRTVLYGGSPITPAVLARTRTVLPAARLGQVYGMTELATVATLLAPGDHILDGPNTDRLRSAGRAAPHAQIRIVGTDGREVPTNRTGEIIVRGSHCSPGYWNKPDETSATFRHGWVHTGDAGHLDERGYLFVDDRIKDMIVTGGENVYSTEVETAICEHPAVAAAAVIGLPDERWGERVHAVIVLRDGATTTIAEIRDHTKRLIAGYKAPRTVDFVDTLPLSGAGKVLKRALKEHYSASPHQQPA
ncbi:long-chain fatty acid--CoA ligase [Rhodococcus sp. NPDC127530]|uniref:acyl-CoA synthetase n=1 Tax=unclassified Rhodococcus (in: high G+C Gram-positive bacteria) TaxID=192944 RepID=UPI00362E2FFE